MKMIDDNKQKLNQICIDHNVKKLYLFGSILTDKFKDDSDIDMLIQFSAMDLNNYFDNYMDLREKWNCFLTDLLI
jgi:predicted nucleotidyltransferase